MIHYKQCESYKTTNEIVDLSVSNPFILMFEILIPECSSKFGHFGYASVIETGKYWKCIIT